MTGDIADMVARLKVVLPKRWFADDDPPPPVGSGVVNTPVLTALLTGLGTAWSWLHTMIAYIRLQTRIGTASDSFLDLISTDFFGTALPRRVNEGDTAFRTRILAELQRTRATRPGLTQALVELTGRTPVIFEPARPADTGGWNVALGYDVAGGYGSLTLPAQVFVTAYRPSAAGIAAIAGWGYGGWRAGASAYATLAMVQGAVTDPDILASVASTIPAGVIAWTRISN